MDKSDLSIVLHKEEKPGSPAENNNAVISPLSNTSLSHLLVRTDTPSETDDCQSNIQDGLENTTCNIAVKHHEAESVSLTERPPTERPPTERPPTERPPTDGSPVDGLSTKSAIDIAASLVGQELADETSAGAPDLSYIVHQLDTVMEESNSSEFKSVSEKLSPSSGMLYCLVVLFIAIHQICGRSRSAWLIARHILVHLFIMQF